MNDLEICRLLITGSVEASDLPELADEDMRESVRQRLAGAGCALAYSEATGRWVARLDGPLPEAASHDPVLRLHAAEQAMLAACWLHLRMLPLERTRIATSEDGQLLANNDETPSITVEDLLAQFHGKLNKGYLEIVLGRLKNAGFVRQHGGRLYAGPLLDTLDEVVAGERARVLIGRHQRLAYLKRRADQIESDEGKADEKRESAERNH